jgi:hypothetical protein
MANQWMITKDLIDDGANEGRKSAGFKPGKPMTVKFRMYDDDMELYFTGIMEEEDFHPLDDFGMPGYGCTTLETNIGLGWDIL